MCLASTKILLILSIRFEIGNSMRSKKGGTPSCLALKPCKIMKKIADPCTYSIRAELRNMDNDEL